MTQPDPAPNDDYEIDVTDPILLHLEVSENDPIDIPIDVVGLDNMTLRNEIILCHAQIEHLHRIVSALNGARAVQPVEATEYMERWRFARQLIDEYEATYGMIVEYDV